MTRTNWILVLVISGLLAVGALGLGKLPALMGVGGRKMLWKPAPVAALATGVIRMAGTTDGTALQSEKSGLEERVAKVRVTAKSQVDAVVAIPVAKAAGVTGEDVAPLVNGWSEAEATNVFTVVSKKVAGHLDSKRANLKVDAGSGAGADPFKGFDPLAHILPGPGDAFFVGESAEQGTRFVWVGDSKQGFWMGTRETKEPPAPQKFVAAGVDLGRNLACRMPKAEEWQAAFKASLPDLLELDGGFGEFLVGGQVIGKADKPGLTDLGPDWNKPLAEKDRKEKTKGRAVKVVVGEAGQQLLEAIVSEIPAARNEGRALPSKINFYREELRKKRQAEEDAKAVGAGETEFRHRWVIDPPIASLKTAP
jgi:hypothetical protein